MSGDNKPASAGSSAGLKTLMVCMLANNLTLGAMAGSFGALLASNEHALGVGRHSISFGMSAMTTTMGLTALVMGNLVRRLTPRLAMAIGVACGAVAFAGIGMTTHIGVALVFWALMGFSAALAAVLGPASIAAEYFPDRIGKALGIMNLPFALFVGPWAVTLILPELGRQGTYLLLAGLLLPGLPLVLRLPAGRPGAASQDRSKVSARSIAARPDFWFISLGIAVIACSGAAFMVHAIAYAQARGMSASVAALMISVYSGAGLAGVPMFGWLADRLGAPRALTLSAIVQCLCWAGLAVFPPSGFLLLSAVLGAGTTPLTTLHGATMAQMFGSKGVGQALGLGYAIKLPFFFLAAPAIGFAFVSLGDYRPAFLGMAAGLAVAVLLLVAGSTARFRGAYA